MSTKVLLIDDAEDFLDLLERLVLTHVPGAQVTRLDPNKMGLSDSGFGLEHYDVVLLDYDLGPARSKSPDTASSRSGNAIGARMSPARRLSTRR